MPTSVLYIQYKGVFRARPRDRISSAVFVSNIEAGRPIGPTHCAGQSVLPRAMARKDRLACGPGFSVAHTPLRSAFAVARSISFIFYYIFINTCNLLMKLIRDYGRIDHREGPPAV